MCFNEQELDKRLEDEIDMEIVCFLYLHEQHVVKDEMEG